MRSFRGKILVIRGGAIGDFILTLPVLAALRRQFPDAHLEVLGYPHIVQLAVAGGLADDVHSIEARALSGFFARGGELAETLVDYFSEFDLIISYLYDPDEIFRTNVALCTGAQFIVGPHRPDAGENIHASRAFLKPLERLAIFDPDPVPHLTINAGNFDPALIALHPGSGSDRKNWPEANWAQLVRYLIESTSSELLLVGGEAEGERIQRLSASLPPQRVRVAQGLALPELARLLNGCGGFIGHDSGISHLAGAVGLAGLILWGETAEHIWRPPSRKMFVLRYPGGLDKLPLTEVLKHLPHSSRAGGAAN